MITIDAHATLGDTLFAAARRCGANALLAVPANAARRCYPRGV